MRLSPSGGSQLLQVGNDYPKSPISHACTAQLCRNWISLSIWIGYRSRTTVSCNEATSQEISPLNFWEFSFKHLAHALFSNNSKLRNSTTATSPGVSFLKVAVLVSFRRGLCPQCPRIVVLLTATPADTPWSGPVPPPKPKRATAGNWHLLCNHTFWWCHSYQIPEKQRQLSWKHF